MKLMSYHGKTSHKWTSTYHWLKIVLIYGCDHQFVRPFDHHPFRLRRCPEARIQQNRKPPFLKKYDIVMSKNIYNLLKAHNTFIWLYNKIYRGKIFLCIYWKATTPLEQNCQKFDKNRPITDKLKCFMTKNVQHILICHWFSR